MVYVLCIGCWCCASLGRCGFGCGSELFRVGGFDVVKWMLVGFMGWTFCFCLRGSSGAAAEEEGG